MSRRRILGIAATVLILGGIGTIVVLSSKGDDQRPTAFQPIVAEQTSTPTLEPTLDPTLVETPVPTPTATPTPLPQLYTLKWVPYGDATGCDWSVSIVGIPIGSSDYVTTWSPDTVGSNGATYATVDANVTPTITVIVTHNGVTGTAGPSSPPVRCRS